MNNIVITERGYIYNERIFNLSEVNSFLEKTPKNINIIIADENILIKRYMNYEKDDINLNKLIKDDFFSGNGLLLDNIYIKKNKELIIYGVRDNYIKLFYERNIKKIMPIQILVSKYLIKNYKYKNLKFIFKFYGKIYFGLIESGNLIDTKVFNEKDEKINEFLNDKNEVKIVNILIKNKKVIIS